MRNIQGDCPLHEFCYLDARISTWFTPAIDGDLTYEGCEDHGKAVWCWPGADCLSDFDTEAKSEDSMYYESESDNSNSSEDDASLDGSDATASDSDSSQAG